MLDVDEVNYSRRELLAYAERGAAPVVNLSSGTNHLPPPMLLIRSGLEAAVDPECFHDYDGPAGHQLARIAVAVHENHLGEPHVDLTDDNVVVTAGASGAMHLAARALREHLGCPEGAAPEALLPVPTFPLAGACLAHAGYAVREVATGCAERWLPTVAELDAAAGPRTRLVYVNTFNNPTGEHYAAGELAELVGWARERGAHVLHDQVSSGVSLDRTMPNLLAIAARQGYADGVVTVGSLSKSRAIPGFRSGWLIAGRRLAERCGRLNELTAPSSVSIAAPLVVLDRLLTCAVAGLPGASDVAGAGRLARLVDRFAREVDRTEPAGGAGREMAAALAALLGRPELLDHLDRWYAELRDVLRRNVRLLAGRFSRLAAGGTPWRGDFNTFVRVPALEGRDYLSTTHGLFRRHGLQTLPAPAFGRSPAWWSERGYWLRLSFAQPPARWTEGLQRLEHVLAAGGGA
jgi:aspartate/methionine/tyrosine aminotransferase